LRASDRHTLAARHNKNRKTRLQPLPTDIADLLRAYLAGKLRGRLLWGGTWAKDRKGADMLRHDLEAAGIPYAVEGPDGPLYGDFHALRHSFLTLLGRGGVDLRTIQELADHSAPLLTARYSHRRIYDLHGAVDKLPGLLPNPAPKATVGVLAATGTDGRQAPSAMPISDPESRESSRVVRRVVVSDRISQQSAAPDRTDAALESRRVDLRKSLENEPVSTCQHFAASVGVSGDERDRTANLRLAKPALSQLSYVPNRKG